MAKRALQHDPEYEAIPAELQEKRIKLIEDNVREQSKKKIESIIKSNFLQEVSSKSSEIDSLEEALQECRATCDRLRACAITKYYACINLDPQTSSSIPSVHPTVKKYLGKHPSGVENDTQCSSSSNSTGESLERISGIPSTSVKQESLYLSPSKDISTRAPRFKTKCKIIVGNVSRFIPSWQRDVSDQSQYKWMVYVRGDKKCPNIETFVSKVTFLLHQSYRPNDVVEIFNPPFHLVKRGWGEFLMRVQLHFHDTRNKPVDILHFLKLDKTCTGLQTLGAETVVDLQLFKPDAIINSHPLCTPTTSRPPEEEESFAELQSSEPTNEINSSEVCSPVKMEIDSDSRASANVPISISVPNNNNTQDVLTMDATTATTEQMMNSKLSVNNTVKPVPSCTTTVNNLAKAPVPNGVNKAYLKCTDSEGRVLLVPQSSLLRIKSQALVKKALPDANKTKETKTAAVPSYILKVVPNQDSGKNQVLLIPMSDKKVQSAVGTPLKCILKPNNVAIDNSQCLAVEKSLCSWEEDLSNIKIDYYKSFVELLKRVCRAFPLVKKDVDNITHPYCASSLEEFLRWNIGKQRASEWKRAGVMRTAILNLLKKHKLKYLSEDNVWSRGALMTWCRKNGYVPMNSEKMTQLPEPKWSGVELCSITNADDIVSTLQKENSRTDSFTDEIDILSVSDDKPVVPKLNQNQQVNLTLPPSDEACTYIKEIASLGGVNIKPLEVEPSTSAPLVEEVILAACRQLATDLIRSSVNEGYKRMGGQLCPEEITVSDVYSAIKEVPQFDFLTNSHLGIPKEPKGET